jgi:glycosyltransferase involved in cell wall biosynthesis
MIKEHLAAVDMVLNCGDFITSRTRHKFPLMSRMIHTLPNGVNPVDFDIATKNELSDDNKKDGVSFLFVGRLSPEKGVHILLDAFHKIFDKYPQSQLDIIGPHSIAFYDFIVGISDDPHVEALAKFYNGQSYKNYLREKLNGSMKDKVRILGKKNHVEVMAHMRQSDIFIFPVVWDEPFGMPVVEAMVNKIPVIASRSGGIVDIVIDGQTGLLVEPDNVDDLAKAMEKLLVDSPLREKFGQAGRSQAVQYFNWDLIYNRLQSYYGDVLK